MPPYGCAMLWFALLAILGFIPASHQTAAGVILTNGTHILNISTTPPTVVVSKPGSRIVALAVDLTDNLLFWSEIHYSSRGIYRSRLDGTQQRQIVSIDVGIVNAVCLDKKSNHIYWTDERKKRIEMANYNGSQRATIINSGLSRPRGITVDTVKWYLFWSDQGTRKIERSRLDGSDRKTIVTTGITWPNQMTTTTSEVVWVDGWDKAIRSCDRDGGNLRVIANLSSNIGANVIYGLTKDVHGALYVSAWKSSKMLKLSGTTSPTITDITLPGGSTNWYSLTYASTVTDQHVCSTDKGGCSHLCLPITATTKRCACPTIGGLILASDRITCKVPDNVLIYASADLGEVRFKDPEETRTDSYVVGRSMRPVAVAYLPDTQAVFWSDVKEKAIYTAKLDGSDRRILIGYNESIGVVDGMFMDAKNKRLYFSNMGSVVLDNVAYSWHRIEAVTIDNQNKPINRQIIVSNVDRPRALWVDSDAGYLYYTDWGATAAVMKANLDGTNVEVINTGVNNPNGLAVVGSTIYVLDSNEKTQKAKNNGQSSTPPTLYKKQIPVSSDAPWNKLHPKGIALQEPFGLGVRPGHLLISDWKQEAILSYDIAAHTVKKLVSNVKSPMGVVYSARVINSGSGRCGSGNGGCQNGAFCVPRPSSEKTCACNNYERNIVDWTNTKCQAPTDFVLFADMNSIGLRSLGGRNSDIHRIIQGTNSYFSNLVALAYDSSSKTVFFSDVNSKAVYKTRLGSGTATRMYWTKHVIDGMAYRDGQLYWTDAKAGKIVTASTSGNETSIRTIISGLDKPRAIVVTASNIYWTEWGGSPRVSQANLNGSSRTMLMDSAKATGLKWPNGLVVEGNKVYVADGHARTIFVYSPSDGTVEQLNYFIKHPKHMYGLAKQGNYFYYTDWKSASLSILDTTLGTVRTLAQGLMRPTDLIVVNPGGVPSRCSGTCGHSCTAQPGGHQCTCPAGKSLSGDGKTCTTAGSYSGSYPAERCQNSCTSSQVCALKTGPTSKTFSCQCKQGHGGSSCKACPEDAYKQEVGMSVCKPCPTGATTGGKTGSSRCGCPQGKFWRNGACGDVKPGTCRTSTAFYVPTCGKSCNNDASCDSIKKCCSNSCLQGGTRCILPQSDTCLYNGATYNLGETFEVNSCLKCTCLANKQFGRAAYGGATCQEKICPYLACNTPIPPAPNDCCAVCPTKTTGGSCPCFSSCPKGTQTHRLGKAQVILPQNLGVRANDNLQRALSLTFQPSILSWAQGVQTVTATATGDGKTKTCTFKVKVKDESPPYFEYCPESQTLISTADRIQVYWRPPLAKDRQSGVTLTNTHKLGTQFPANQKTIVKYTATNGEGQASICSFTFNVKQIKVGLDCPALQHPLQGHLGCNTTGSGALRCRLRCESGFSPGPNIPLEYLCGGTQWQPAFPDNFVAQACLYKTPLVLKMSFGFSLGVTCPGNSKDFKAKAAKIINAILEQNSLCSKTESGTVITVCPHTVINCKDSRRRRRAVDDAELAIIAQAQVPATNTQRVTNAMTSMIRDINNLAKSGGLNFNVDGRTYSPSGIGSVPSTANEECGSGQYRSGQACVTCPVGTMLANPGSATSCTTCPPHTYQDEPGQTSCKACPDEGKSPAGSYAPSQCTHTPSNANNLTLIIGIVVAVVVVLIIIIVIAVVCAKKRNASTTSKEGNRHANPAFDGNAAEPTYADIPANHYDHLAKGNASKENPYDSIIPNPKI